MEARTLTAQDRCDVGGCSARARLRAVMVLGELLFCGHHATKHYDALENQGAFLDDQRVRVF